jgi:PAS domain S-box-containing protein
MNVAVNYKILLVTNNKDVQKSLSAKLAVANYICDSATNGNQAVKLLFKSTYGLVIADAEMPTMNGIELAATIKNSGKLKHIPIIIFCSLAAEKQTLIKCCEVGGVGFFTIPVEEPLLWLKVQNCLHVFQTNEKLMTANKLLEKAALHSQISYQDLYRSLPQVIFILNREGIVVNINREGILKWGHTSAEMLNRHYSNFPILINALSGKAPEDIMDEFLGFLGMKKQEFNFEKKDKTIMYAESELNIVTIEGMPHVQICISDITDKKKMQLHLKAAEQQFSTVFRTANDAVVLANEAGNVIFWNDCAAEIFGYAESEVLHISVDAILPGKFESLHNNELAEQTNEARIMRKPEERLAIKKDGSVFPVEVSVSYWGAASGGIVYCLIVRDVSLRKLQENAILESEALSKGILAAIPSGIIIINKQGIVIGVNEGWNKMIDLSPSKYMQKIVLGSNYFDVCKEAIANGLEKTSRILNAVQAVLHSELETVEAEWEYGQGEHKRWITLCINRFQAQEIYAVLRADDITQKKLAETNLEQSGQKTESLDSDLKKANFELNKFVYGASHDLREPVTTILGLINISKNLTDIDEILQFLSMIEASTYRLDNTIREILEYSRNSRLLPLIEQVNVRDIYNTQLASLTKFETTERINFIAEITDDLPFFTDKFRITVVMQHLLLNAIKYQDSNQENSFIRFTFTATADEGIITVEDNGEGIAQDKQDKIFDMFYRGSQKSPGSGLGLFICREILEKLEGSISLKSELGEGCLVTVKIPNRAPKAGLENE